MKKHFLSLVFLFVILLSLLGCRKMDYSIDFSNEIDLRRTMTANDVIMYEKSFGHQEMETDTNQYGDSILKFYVDSNERRNYHIYCFNKTTGELQFASYKEEDPLKQPYYKKAYTYVKKVTPAEIKNNGDSIKNSYWYGFLDDAKCSIQLTEETGVLEGSTLWVRFGEYKNNSFVLYGAINP